MVSYSGILFIASLASTSIAWSDSAVYKIVLLTAEPPVSQDPWQCVTANLTQYFDVPKPTGILLTAINSYADDLIKTCTASGIDRIQGACYPAHDNWCKFSAAAPASVLADYKLYGSAASAWWAAHSTNAVDLATKCPDGWFDASFELPGGPTWLNNTINLAACYADTVTTTTSSGSKSSSKTSSISATTGPAVTTSVASATSSFTSKTTS